MDAKNRRRLAAAIAVVIVTALVPACRTATPVKAEELKSDKQRITSASQDVARVSALVKGNTAFALDMYRSLFDRDANVFYSPYSVSLALAMTYAGARGTTESQMASALRFDLPQGELHAAFNALETMLKGRGEKVTEEGQRFTLHVASAIWGQTGYEFRAEFLDLLAQYYGAGLRLLDFQKAPEDARLTINKWVEQQTEEKIKNLLPSGSVSNVTRMVLSNAVYFNASWLFPFDKKSTRSGAFHRLDGSQVTAPMMVQSKQLGYVEGADYQAVEIPYVGNQLSMVVLLPKDGQFERFANSLDAASLDAILGGIEHQPVNLTMPRFKFEFSASLKEHLVRLGMIEAFSDSADLTGMASRRELFISDVFHKAFVSVNEEGTEAAAATAVVVGVTSMPAQPAEMTLDRPFVFAIRDMASGALLFLGHVVNPAA